MLRLLKDIATDPNEAVDFDNPLRQVIVNTHSPVVVGQVDDQDLVFAELKETVESKRRFDRVSFACLPGTWCASGDISTISKGDLIGYLNPIPITSFELNGNGHVERNRKSPVRTRRVVDRPDLQEYLPFGFEER